MNETLYRILRNCILAARAQYAYVSMEESVARQAASLQRTRGAEEDQARSRLSTAQLALGLEESKRTHDRTQTLARSALGKEAPPLDKLIGYLKSLQPSGGEVKAEAAVLKAQVLVAEASLLKSDANFLQASFDLSARFDPMYPSGVTVNLAGSLSYKPPNSGTSAMITAAERAANAAMESVRFEQEALTFKLAELKADIESIERRMPSAQEMLKASAVLASFAEGRLELGVITAGERDAALESISSKKATLDALTADYALLLLDYARATLSLVAQTKAVP